MSADEARLQSMEPIANAATELSHTRFDPKRSDIHPRAG
jgi:hypothetical protein